MGATVLGFKIGTGIAALAMTVLTAVPRGGVWATGYSGTSGSFNPLALKTAG